MGDFEIMSENNNNIYSPNEEQLVNSDDPIQDGQVVEFLEENKTNNQSRVSNLTEGLDGMK